MIRDGYDNINILFNDTQSLINFIKISENKEMHHEYFYEKYFKKDIDVLKKKYLTGILSTKKKKKNKMYQFYYLRIYITNFILQDLTKSIV